MTATVTISVLVTKLFIVFCGTYIFAASVTISVFIAEVENMCAA